MAESPRDTQDKTPETEKKPPETVLLTSDELRAIAGGAGVGQSPLQTPATNEKLQAKKF
jgi:hypothetical protein